jgi:hypothetical protein
MKTLLLASLVLAVTSATSFAGTPWINARQNAQWNRISNGFSSGRLTTSETARLINGQAHVQNLKNQANADGVVTLRERARINFAQDVQSARIFIKKHN